MGTERLSYSDVSDSSSSESDVPLSRVGNKRSRKPSSRLAESYACSDLDSGSGDSRGKRVKRKQGKSPRGKKIKVVAKKVTETWCIEKAAPKGKKRRKKRNEQNEESDNSEVSEAEDVIPPVSKGKSSKAKPPKNAQFSRGSSRPRRAKQFSYKEY